MTTLSNLNLSSVLQHRAAALALIIAFLVASAVASAVASLRGTPSLEEGFTAEGIVQFKLVNEHGDVTQRQSEHFEVFVKGCKWFIATAPYPASDTDNITRWEIGSDGGDEIYQIAAFSTNALNPNSLNKRIGVVQSDSVPSNIAGNQVAELWLAYASQCYFDSITNHMLKPVYRLLDPSSRAKDYAVNAEWKRFDDSPRLPQQVTFKEDKIEAWFNGSVIAAPAPPPFGKGYIRAEYTTQSTTNVGNLLIPKAFVFKEFAVVQTSKTESHLVMYRLVEGHVTNAQPSCSRNQFIPALTEATYIDERRFSRSPKPIDALSYMVTNGVWPRANSPELQALYERELNTRAHMLKPIDTSPRRPPEAGKGKRVFVMLCIVLSLLLLGSLVKKTWHPRRNE